MLAVKNVEAPPTPVVSLPEVLDVDAEEEEEGGGDAQSQQQSARELALQVGEEPTSTPTSVC